jgi:4-hydroxy-3-methylbut-2-en-1-yl diphosphate reductase
MKVNLASHYGMCFGVRDAIAAAEVTAQSRPATLLGQLVHNPVVSRRFSALGVHQGQLEAVGQAATRDVIITAHGASDNARASWAAAGFRITDTTCPLVRKAHHALAELVVQGFHPVVIGQAGHVEVRGLVGDFPGASVVLSREDIAQLPELPAYGVVSQTTQPLPTVLELVKALREQFPQSSVHFRDTVCQPTKQRQKALEQLCAENEVVLVVGGRNSNNSRQLVDTALGFGCRAYLIEGPEDIDAAWLAGVHTVGVTAGTSTLEASVQAVVEWLRKSPLSVETP